MSNRNATRLAVGLWCATLVVGVGVTVIFGITDLEGANAGSQWALGGIALVAAQVYAGIGLLIVSCRPENPIGWILCVAPLVCQLANLADSYAHFADDRGLPGVAWAAVVVPLLWAIGAGLVTIYGFLLFPDGHLPSPDWRPLAWASAVLIAVYAIAGATAPGSIGSPEGYENPIGIPGMGAVAEVATAIFIGVILLVHASLVARYRRSRGDERRQIQVVAWALCLLLATMGLFELVDAATDGRAAGTADIVRFSVWISASMLIPIAVGVAILRYRLYDFDRVVSRTLVYGSLTVILGAAYAGLVLAGQAVFSSFAGGGDLAIATSTLVVAALFLPLRSRLQRLVDRRFYRRRYDAERTLEAFGARLREQVDLDDLRADLEGAVRETMQPAHVSLWLPTGTSR